MGARLMNSKGPTFVLTCAYLPLYLASSLVIACAHRRPSQVPDDPCRSSPATGNRRAVFFENRLGKSLDSRVRGRVYSDSGAVDTARVKIRRLSGGIPPDVFYAYTNR